MLCLVFEKSVYQGIYLFLNYLILDMYIKPSTFRFWCFIFDKMVGSKYFLWSSTFTWSNSVRLDIRWDEGWRDEMTTAYAYKLIQVWIWPKFQKPLYWPKFEYEHDKGYRGSVQLTPLESLGTSNLLAHCVQRNLRSNEFEDANSVMYNTIDHMFFFGIKSDY